MSRWRLGGAAVSGGGRWRSACGRVGRGQRGVVAAGRQDRHDDHGGRRARRLDGQRDDVTGVDRHGRQLDLGRVGEPTLGVGRRLGIDGLALGQRERDALRLAAGVADRGRQHAGLVLAAADDDEVAQLHGCRGRPARRRRRRRGRRSGSATASGRPTAPARHRPRPPAGGVAGTVADWWSGLRSAGPAGFGGSRGTAYRPPAPERAPVRVAWNGHSVKTEIVALQCVCGPLTCANAFALGFPDVGVS